MAPSAAPLFWRPSSATCAKHDGLVAVRRIDLPDRARAAARAPLAGHPRRSVGAAVEAEGRGGAEIDVRRIGIVEGDAEDLADFGRRHRQALLLVQPVMTLRRLAGPRTSTTDPTIPDGSMTLASPSVLVPEKRVT
jgi:hypothetical protein